MDNSKQKILKKVVQKFGGSAKYAYLSTRNSAITQLLMRL